MLLGAEANQFVLVQNPKLFSAKKAWEEFIGVLFRGGLLNRDGPDHRKFRRLLTPAFRQEALDSYLELAEPIMNQSIASWPRECPDIYGRVKELTLQIALRVFFGITLEKELKTYNQLITEVVAGSIAVVKTPIIGVTYHKALRAREQLIRLLQPVVKQRRQTPTKDMIGQLCQVIDEEGHTLSDDEIIDQMIFVMMAAHDTTASTLASTFYELAKNPQYQKLLETHSVELDAKKTIIQDLPEQLDLHQLVIKETLRLHTPLKVILRVSNEGFQFGGYEFPANQPINVCPAFCHYMPEYWTDPYRFDPARFGPERAEHKKSPYAFIPFGGGLHLCLGQFFAEKFLTVILHKVILRHRWQIPAIETRKFQQVPINVPKGVLPVVFEPRLG
jgi:cytochrome P450